MTQIEGGNRLKVLLHLQSFWVFSCLFQFTWNYHFVAIRLKIGMIIFQKILTVLPIFNRIAPK